ncbi:MAG: hypothetical protein IIT46_01460 [Lachnospiraceae bacterium]|nr:hypothetical protein [Lachnospiraceae bacterium]
MFIQAFDSKQYCCVNDKDIYILEEIPEHEAKSKDLDIDYTPPKPQKIYIPPMKHPWRRQHFGKFVKQQKHHWNDPPEKNCIIKGTVAAESTNDPSKNWG